MNSCVLLLLVHTLGLEALEESHVEIGKNAHLDCHVPEDIGIVVGEWRRPDLSEGYVFFLRENRPYESFQHPYFKGRVKLKDPNMKNGTMSVILHNTTVNDTGVYECRVTVKGKEHSMKHPPVIQSLIKLIVRPADQKTTTAEPELLGFTPGPPGGQEKNEKKEDRGKEDGVSRGHVIPLVVLSVVILIILVVVAVIWRKKRERMESVVNLLNC